MPAPSAPGTMEAPAPPSYAPLLSVRTTSTERRRTRCDNKTDAGNEEAPRCVRARAGITKVAKRTSSMRGPMPPADYKAEGHE